MAITLIALSGIACGGGDKEPASPGSPSASPGGNQPPIISSLSADSTTTSPGGTIEVKCMASDPDNDRITYKWSATAGNIGDTESNSSIRWLAPDNYGDYTVTCSVEDGKGGSVQSSVTLSVISNQNPVISSLIADPATVGLGGSSTITCLANDPDGDPVNFVWESEYGKVSGVGNTVTYVPPGQGGTYGVTVKVTDSKGATTSGNVQVTVATATKTVTLTVVQEESGTVSESNKDKSLFRAGDDEKNRGYRAFWSFNIFSLNNTEIKEAKLTFKTRTIAGDPFARVGSQSMGGFRLWRVAYPTEELPSFGITGEKLQLYSSSPEYKAPTTVDVTPEVKRLVDAAAGRFQVEALWMKVTNGNSVAEWIDWSDVTLTVTYTEK